MSEQWDYKKAGLDLAKYEETIAGIQPLLARTHDRKRVIPPPFPPRKGGKGVGGFASLFDLNPDGRYRHPVLVTCTDGVGSKLKIAALMAKFDTVGVDLVAMSVNDLICTGGEPLVFLDYLAMHRDDPELSKALLQGISDACVESGCSLVGGETAILPDFYQPGDFDLAGFAAGVVERDRVIDGRAIRTGDAVVGVASSGVHSNGYSLVRKVVFEAAGLNVTDHVAELGRTVGEELLTPTRLYVKPVRSLLESVALGVVHGLANITGGGLPDNIGRILPPGKRVKVKRGSWPVPPVFGWLQKLGNVADAEMFRVFNMGVGFAVVCEPDAAPGVIAHLAKSNLPAWKIGDVTDGEVGVEVV
ncbi:phosphoribosylformylglycinamidine cyclo-ligase [Gemmata sp.]|uniref:phosphoribosylformylglycinamidine cyclo-ligase n=1 Tax=Gemmata sp. TaxID=1914242 RepID=UPI003F708B64